MSGLQCYSETIFLKGLAEEDLPKISHLTGFASCNISQDQPTLGQFSVNRDHGRYYLPGDDSEPQSLEFIAQIFKGRLLSKLAATKTELTFLRGDVAKLANGNALLITGPSISGKTTLAQKFVATGASAWSSDVAVFASNGELLRFPDIEQPSSGLTTEAIIMSRFEPSATWSPESLSPGQTLLKLTSNLVMATPERQAEIFGLLGKAAALAKLRCEGKHGDCSDVVDYFRTLMNHP